MNKTKSKLNIDQLQNQFDELLENFNKMKRPKLNSGKHINDYVMELEEYIDYLEGDNIIEENTDQYYLNISKLYNSNLERPFFKFLHNQKIEWRQVGTNLKNIVIFKSDFDKIKSNFNEVELGSITKL